MSNQLNVAPATEARRLRRAAILSPPLGVALLAFWVLLQVAVAWAPFQFEPPRPVDNGVRPIDGGGLAFEGQRAVAVTDPPLPWNQARALTVDLLVRTPTAHQEGPARILTIAHDHRQANLMIGQHAADLVVRVRRQGSRATGQPPFLVPGVFNDDGWRRIKVEIAEMVRVTVNGEVQVDEPLGARPFDTWDPDYGIALGDEVRVDRVWHGWIVEAALTIDGYPHRLLPSDRLEIPERVWLIPDRIYETTSPPTGRAALRGLLHLLIFVPGGWLIADRLNPHRRILRVVLIAGTLAASLQLGKVVVAGRHPSPFTIGVQVLGALIGALLVHQARRRQLETA